MNFIPTACLPWLTSDVDAEQDTLAHLFLERIEQLLDSNKDMTCTEYEKSDAVLRRMLTACYNDLDRSVEHWKAWMNWRQGSCGLCTEILTDKINETCKIYLAYITFCCILKNNIYSFTSQYPSILLNDASNAVLRNLSFSLLYRTVC